MPGQVFLGDLGGRVDTARLQGSVLVDEARFQRAPAAGTRRVELAARKLRRRPRHGLDRPVLVAVVATLAVDDHRAGEDQAVDPGPGHPAEQYSGRQVVVRHVLGQVAEVDTHADHRGVMHHQVDAAKGRRHHVAIAHVAEQAAVGHLSMSMGGRMKAV